MDGTKKYRSSKAKTLTNPVLRLSHVAFCGLVLNVLQILKLQSHEFKCATVQERCMERSVALYCIAGASVGNAIRRMLPAGRSP